MYCQSTNHISGKANINDSFKRDRELAAGHGRVLKFHAKIKKLKRWSCVYKICPVTHLTTPKLELTVAVFYAQVSQQFHLELELQIDEDFNLTGIKVLLWYVSNGSRRFHVFLSNRLQEIQGSTHRRVMAICWIWIESSRRTSHRMKTDEIPFERWIVGTESQ